MVPLAGRSVKVFLHLHIFPGKLNECNVCVCVLCVCVRLHWYTKVCCVVNPPIIFRGDYRKNGKKEMSRCIDMYATYLCSTHMHTHTHITKSNEESLRIICKRWFYNRR